MSLFAKNSTVKRVWLGAILGWDLLRSFPGAHEWGQSALKKLTLVCGAGLHSSWVVTSDPMDRGATMEGFEFASSTFDSPILLTFVCPMYFFLYISFFFNHPILIQLILCFACDVFYVILVLFISLQDSLSTWGFFLIAHISLALFFERDTLWFIRYLSFEPWFCAEHWINYRNHDQL